MVEGYSCYLDTEKVQSTVETLKSIDTCLSNKDLNSSFYEMEDLLNKINFEHGNFSSTYKETLGIMEEEVKRIKKDIYNLGYGIEKASSILMNEKDKTVRDIQELSNEFGESLGVGIPSNSPLRVLLKKNNANGIAEVITAGVEQEETSSYQINTVPLGIGIGVAGVVGAVGAIIYDSLRGNKEDNSIQDYIPPKEDEIHEMYHPQRDFVPEYEFDNPSPYFAVHNRDTMKKFYSDDNNHSN